jgi:hypothetical protein
MIAGKRNSMPMPWRGCGILAASPPDEAIGTVGREVAKADRIATTGG